jgi:hypothetical protein
MLHCNEGIAVAEEYSASSSVAVHGRWFVIVVGVFCCRAVSDALEDIFVGNNGTHCMGSRRMFSNIGWRYV